MKMPISMNYIQISYRISLVVLLFTLARYPGLASDISFTISPMTKEITVDAGMEKTGTLDIRNDGALSSAALVGPLRLKIYLTDWRLDSNGSMSFFAPGTTPASCSGWFQVNPSELTIAPGSSATLRYTIRVPQDATGTYHTLLMFESAPTPETINARQVAVNGRIGVTLYLQVGPQVKRAKITAFDVTGQHTTVTVENTGTSQIHVQGTLKYVDQDNNLLAQVPLPNALILPGNDGTRILCLDTPKLPGKTAVTATAVMDYGGEVLLGARTHATLP